MATTAILKWLSVADRFAKAYLDERLLPLGLNSSQHLYLLRVCRQPGLSQDSLLSTVYVHPSNVVRMVAALERKGFLRRVPCAQDKRTWQLYPTERALAVVDQVEAACRETEAALLDGLPQEFQDVFQRIMPLAARAMAQKMGVVRREDAFHG